MRRTARKPENNRVHEASLGIAAALALAAFAAPAQASPPRRVMPPDLPLSSAGPDSFVASFETTKGAVTMKARRATSPLGVDRLYHLVRGGYYDGLVI